MCLLRKGGLNEGKPSHQVGLFCVVNLSRRGAGVVERGGLENRYAGDCIEGSNPSPSASLPFHKFFHVLSQTDACIRLRLK